MLVPRERPLSILRSGEGRTLTLVDAPAGAGKTTAVAQWLVADADRSHEARRQRTYASRGPGLSGLDHGGHGPAAEQEPAFGAQLRHDVDSVGIIRCEVGDRWQYEALHRVPGQLTDRGAPG